MKIKGNICITVVSFLMVGFALIALLIYPALRDIESVSQEILSGRIEAASMDFQNRELDNFKKKYKEYGPHLQEMNQSFVDIKNPVDFIEFLEKTATDSGIDADINLNSSLKKEAPDTQPAVLFQIFAEGDFSNILLFSERLESGPYLVTIKSLLMKKAEKDVFDKTSTSSDDIEANFSIEVVSQ